MTDQPKPKPQGHLQQDSGVDPTSVLDDYFVAARQTAPQPSADLMRRVMADALAAQDAALAPRRSGLQHKRPGIWAQLREALGGWPAMGGLAMAGVMGLVIGIAAPGGLSDLTTAVLAPANMQDIYLVDLMPDMEFDIAMDLNEG